MNRSNGTLADLSEIVEFLDACLQVSDLPDYEGAWNGLQVASRAPVERVCVAVDACQETIERAAGEGADLLLVHHGLFWSEPLPITGRSYRRLRALFDADLALYAAHLPLDIHREIGNNILLLRALGLEPEGWFGEWKGIEGFGPWAAADLPLRELADRVARACGDEPVVIDGGPERVRRVGVVTGGAASMIPEARAAGLDAFVTGEGSHHTFHDARELGLNVLYAGHYATETFGVKALAELLSERFDVEASFIDYPTGL